MKVRWLAVLLLLAAVAYGLGIVSSASASAQDPRTITVRPGESIQAAIDSASEGDTILVQAGTYQEDLLITKPLTLRGEGRAEVTLRGSVSVLSTRLVTVSGFTITGGLGVEVRDSATVTIADNAILGSRADGLLLSNATATVRGNAISESQGNGILVTMGSQATISNNTISDNAATGIPITLSSTAAISANVITGNGSAGISVSASTVDTRNNTIRDNAGCGIQASEDSSLTGQATLEEVSGNRGGNLCDAAIALDHEPPPAPRSVTLEPPGWTNENAFTASWEEPEELTAVVAAWYKFGEPPTTPEDGTRVPGKPLHLEAPGEGEQPVFLWLEDAAGNKDHRNRAQATLRLDQTPPTIEAQPNRPPDANGWYNHEVTVHFKCDDRLSGIASCTSPVTVSREGKDQTIRGEAVDRAGNRATAAIRISLDKTPPTGSLTINDGAEETHSLTVTLRIEAEDNLSGLAEMRFSNDGHTWSEWEPFQETREDWDLSAYGGSEEEGTKTVWAQLKDKAGNISRPFSDRISFFHPAIRVPEDYSTIQEAIAAASEGARILIGPGTYEENLVIGKSLTLKGAGREQTKIKGKEEDKPVIRIESDKEIEVVIEGLTVAEAKVGEERTWKEDGIRIGGKATVTIRNSRISGNGDDGIVMLDSSQATISGSEISGNGYDGIVMGGSSQATISGSEISGNGWDGIYMGDSSRATISDSQISGNGDVGIFMTWSSQATISGSEISGNGWDGIFMRDFTQATISDSKISGNGGHGIGMHDSSQATIRDNEIFGNKRYGVALYQRPCFDTNEKFEGKVEGSGNEIHDNGEGNVCPSKLEFLMRG